MGFIKRRLAPAGLACALASLMLLGGGVPASAGVEELPISPHEAVQPTDESTELDEPPASEEPASPKPTEGEEGSASEESSAEPSETPPPSSPPEEHGDGADESDEAADDAGEEASESPAPQDHEPAPFAVPVPEQREAVITVKVGGDRTGNTSVGNLAGVTLRLHDGGSSGPGAAISEDWATCVSDSGGDCSFTIPETQQEISERQCTRWFWGLCLKLEQVVVQAEGQNRDSRFWIAAGSAPSGWHLSNNLVTGTSATRDYAFRTGTQLRAGETYRSGRHFMTEFEASLGNPGSPQDSSGVWSVSRHNPQLPQRCQAGLTVALVLDLSASVSDAGALTSLQTASKDMADALAGTGSNLGLYTFGTSAPLNSANSGRNYDSMPVDQGNNLQVIKDRIDDYRAGTGDAGGTNWDRGISQVAESARKYDLALVVTDGMPTFHGPGRTPSGPGNSTRFTEVEQAIFSANALKSQGTRVLAVGVGDGVSAGAANLRAISGQTSYASAQSAHEADYFQTGWTQLADLLEEVARGATCQANIEVSKTVTPYGEDGPRHGGSGWEFEAAASNGKIMPGTTQSTNDDGQVDYALKFETPTAAPAVLTIEEILKDDSWSLEDVSCTVNGAHVETGKTKAEITVSVGDDVACTFHNVEQLVPEISIEKQAWDTSNAEELGDADEISAGSELLHGSTVTWTYTVLNTGETRLDDIRVTDDQLAEDAVQCPRDSLEPNESMVCTATGAVTADP